ncbi:MAG: stage II sporulation protein R [Oscillospiraceae bacterium]|nr:stage II sporulation protein R [Oscillospiraceae bacterium]MBQ7013851.1 stage II sporulation protein R [Oscillospiraceae bacterium]
MRRWELAAALGLIGAIFCSSNMDFSERMTHLREQVLRLHILANSDSPEDQALKLHVRDTLLAASDTLFAGCDTPEEMRERAADQLETIRLIAQDAVEEAGFDDVVSVQLVNMEFDAKQYEEITMPAGAYDAVRILIGEAEGQNWWCVMYPPLCIPSEAVVLGDPEAAEQCFGAETAEILTDPPRYEVKLKCLEWWEELVKFVKD